jgi:hypothetical protein
MDDTPDDHSSHVTTDALPAYPAQCWKLRDAFTKQKPHAVLNRCLNLTPHGVSLTCIPCPTERSPVV